MKERGNLGEQIRKSVDTLAKKIMDRLILQDEIERPRDEIVLGTTRHLDENAQPRVEENIIRIDTKTDDLSE